MSMSELNKSALIIGGGSIGLRHQRLLAEAGVETTVVDPDPKRCELAKKAGAIAFTVLDDAFSSVPYTLALICTPPSLHIEMALACAEYAETLFIEKPVAHTHSDLRRLLDRFGNNDKKLLVGYNLRFEPGVRRVKRALERGEIGAPYFVRSEFGQYLPDWRPGRDYREVYTARKNLGGGILLDASHELDLLLWLFGRPSGVFASLRNIGELEVDVESCVDLHLTFPKGIEAQVHLDFLQAGYQRVTRIVGQEGSAEWDYGKRRVLINRKTRAERMSLDRDVDVMYRAQRDALLKAADGETTIACTLKQAAAVLDVIEAARISSENKTFETITWSI